MSKESKMSMIIDLDEYVAFTRLQLKLFKKSKKIDPGDPTDEELRQLVYDLIDANIQDNLLWCKRYPGQNISAIQKVFPWWSVNGKEDFHSDFYEEVISRLEDFYSTELDWILCEKTWDIISVTRKASVCVISRGEDYRIVDWHHIQNEKVKNGNGSQDFIPLGLR
jgi:hypothetical protein